MKKTLFVKNAAILTTSGFVLKFLGIVFKIWLTRKIGQSGIGLYQIVFSFYFLASTFATTGIPTAVTRMCGDEIESGSKAGIKKILRFSIIVMLVLSLFTFIALFFGAKIISRGILSDLRASFSIKVMGFSLPFTAICSCLRGYFIARRKATPPAVSQIFEQLLRIFVVFFAIKMFSLVSADVICGVVMLGDAVAEGLSCGFLSLMYRKDLINIKDRGGTTVSLPEIITKTRQIALPITTGRYLNSLLRTFENILVPKKLVSGGRSDNMALSEFGMVKGSALPVLLFPSTLLNAMSTLLLPELSVAIGKKRPFEIKSTVEEMVVTVSVVSYLISALFFVFGKELGFLLYNNRSVGVLIHLLAPLIPLMYLDSICDGMLKGLNKQNFTLILYIADSSARLLLIALFVPKYGIIGFVGIMYFSNAFTGFLNLRMLIKTSKAKIKVCKFVLAPICCAIIVALVSDTLIRATPITNTLVYIMLVSAISCPLYFFFISRLSGLRLSRFFK